MEEQQQSIDQRRRRRRRRLAAIAATTSMLAISTAGGMTLLLHHHNHRSNINNDDASNSKTMDHYHTGVRRGAVRRREERNLNNNLNYEEIMTNWRNTQLIPMPSVHTDPTPDVWLPSLHTDPTETTTTTTTLPEDLLADLTTTESPMIVTLPTPIIASSDVSTTTTTTYEEFLADDPSATTTTEATEPIDMPKYWWPIEPIESGELPVCVYSNHYPDYYNHESYRHVTLFDAYEECCTAYESCGATTTSSSPMTAAVVADKEYWYPQLSPDGIRRCTYNANYPAEYTISEGIQSTILFESQLDCCAAYPLACAGFFWYPPPDGGSISIEYCMHGNDYPVEWTGDEDYLFLSQGGCCDRWCGSAAGDVVFGDDGAVLTTVAAAATITTTATSPEDETTTTMGDTFGFVATDPSLETTSNTIFGGASTTSTPESTTTTTATLTTSVSSFSSASSIAFPEATAPTSSSATSTKATHDETTTTPQDAAAGWYESPTEYATCTNSPDYPPQWDTLPPVARSYIFFETPEDCCEQEKTKYPNQDCSILDVHPQGGSGAGVTSTIATAATTSTSTQDVCADCIWHESYSSHYNACTNSPKYPSAWDSLPPESRPYLFFETPEDCCEAKFPGDDVCAVLDVVVVESSDPPPQDSTCTADCIWYESPTEYAQCTHFPSYPPAWFEQPHFLFATSDECCTTRFPYGSCTHIQDVESAMSGGGNDYAIENFEDEQHQLLEPFDLGTPTPQWEITDVQSYSGSHSITNIPITTSDYSTTTPTSADLTLHISVATPSTVSCMGKIDISMPFDFFSLYVNGEQRNTYHEPIIEDWIPIVTAIGSGDSTILFRVERSPGFGYALNHIERVEEVFGTGHVWLDDCVIAAYA